MSVLELVADVAWVDNQHLVSARPMMTDTCFADQMPIFSLNSCYYPHYFHHIVTIIPFCTVKHPWWGFLDSSDCAKQVHESTCQNIKYLSFLGNWGSVIASFQTSAIAMYICLEDILVPLGSSQLFRLLHPSARQDPSACGHISPSSTMIRIPSKNNVWS